jgi:hypothetical protein
MKTLTDDPEVKAMAAQGRRWDAAEAAANAAAAPYREGMKKFYGRGLTQTEIEQSDALSDEANRIFRKVLGEHGFTHAAMPGAGADNGETGAEPVRPRKLFGPLVFWLVVFSVLELVLVYFAWRLGQGDNLWQKILASGQFFAIPPVVCVGGFLLHSGEAGRRLLKRCSGKD